MLQAKVCKVSTATSEVLGAPNNSPESFGNTVYLKGAKAEWVCVCPATLQEKSRI